MTIQLQNTYYVGINQPYRSIRQVINTIWSALESGDYLLPSSSAADGGNINIVLVGGGQFTGFTIPDNTTLPLAASNRYLVIKRQERTENGELITDNVPIISPLAASDLPNSDNLIGINLGSNNPNIKLIGLRVSGFVIGVAASFNTNKLYIDRCIITNNTNAQVYVHDSDFLYITNSILVGGQYGIVTQFVKNLRVYHNTIFLDGKTAESQTTKAGIILQGERLFSNTSPSTIYCLGNIVYTIGCPAAIFYEEDLKNNRIVSNYNNFYSQNAAVQLRQDNATLPEDSQQIVKANYSSINQWKLAGNLGTRLDKFIDNNSISAHPIFIQSLTLGSRTGPSNFVNLNLIENSPMLAKVPSWYYSSDSFYIPTDFDSDIISTDILLATREQPYTAIGCNDSKSLNGFFGQDIFTSPLELDPEKKCDLDPLSVISSQQFNMQYPAINAGYFWSHERPYYLYGKKHAGLLGEFAVTQFKVPGFIDHSKPISVKARGVEISSDDWDILGRLFVLYHRKNNITSYNDEIEINCHVKYWYMFGFSTEPATYLYKISDGVTKFVLPDSYQSSAPVVITDDRIGYLNPSDIVGREFKVSFKDSKSYIEFGGNDNLFYNGDFTETVSGLTPINWACSINSSFARSVFLVGTNYAYWGDHCVAISCNDTPGSITSPLVDVSTNDSLAISWHTSLPNDITGVSGQAIESLTGAYYVSFYNNYNELMPDYYSGEFVAYTNKYTRYCISFGTSDQIIDTNNTGVPSAELISLTDSPVSLPDNVAKLEITFSGYNYSSIMDTGAFYMLDAAQAEYDVNPTHFHPRPSFTNMTVEFETDPSGVFIDNRMNISSIFNENPNGFLYISDMPASIWNGPMDPEVTTLHEYRWPHGRINVLPWARLFGKDKLHQKVFFNDYLTPPKDIIVPYLLPRKATESIITPGLLVCKQDSDTFEGFNIQVIDDIGNPYGLRSYVLHVYELNERFPGWVSKKFMGAKEQLGTTIYGQLTNNGTLNGFYSAPSSANIRYVGPIPSPSNINTGYSGTSDYISSLKTNYSISSYNFGNITIIGEKNKFVNTHGENITGLYQSVTNNNSQVISLEYPPMYGSVSVMYNNTVLTETNVDPQSEEFLVHYPIGKIELPISNITGSIYIEYTPKYAYPNPSDYKSIIMHNNKLFGSYSGAIQVDYDAQVQLELRVSDILNREYVNHFEVIAQNPQLSEVTNSNISLEF